MTNEFQSYQPQFLTFDTYNSLETGCGSQAAAQEIDQAFENVSVGTISLASGNILVGQSNGIGGEVSMSGDVGIAASGSTTIQSGAIGSSKIASNVIQTVSIPLSSSG